LVVFVAFRAGFVSLPTMCGISLFAGAMVGIILDIFRPDLSRQTEFLLYSHELILYGIGLGIILLLIFSGEIFKALRALAAERK
jgi:hypothetical protein